MELDSGLSYEIVLEKWLVNSKRTCGCKSWNACSQISDTIATTRRLDRSSVISNRNVPDPYALRNLREKEPLDTVYDSASYPKEVFPLVLLYRIESLLYRGGRFCIHRHSNITLS